MKLYSCFILRFLVDFPVLFSPFYTLMNVAVAYFMFVYCVSEADSIARHTIQIYFTELLQICSANMRADQKTNDWEEWKNSIFRACHNIFSLLFAVAIFICTISMYETRICSFFSGFIRLCRAWFDTILKKLPSQMHRKRDEEYRQQQNEEKLKSYDSHLMHFGFDCLLRYIYNAHSAHPYIPKIGCSVWMSIGNMNELNGFFLPATFNIIFGIGNGVVGAAKYRNWHAYIVIVQGFFLHLFLQEHLGAILCYVELQFGIFFSLKCFSFDFSSYFIFFQHFHSLRFLSQSHNSSKSHLFLSIVHATTTLSTEIWN